MARSMRELRDGVLAVSFGAVPRCVKPAIQNAGVQPSAVISAVGDESTSQRETDRLDHQQPNFRSGPGPGKDLFVQASTAP